MGSKDKCDEACKAEAEEPMGEFMQDEILNEWHRNCKCQATSDGKHVQICNDGDQFVNDVLDLGSGAGIVASSSIAMLLIASAVSSSIALLQRKEGQRWNTIA